MSKNKEKNLTLPGFTARTSLIGIKHYRGNMHPYSTGLRQAIQPLMKASEYRCDDICDACERNGSRCCQDRQGNCYCC